MPGSLPVHEAVVRFLVKLLDASQEGKVPWTASDEGNVLTTEVGRDYEVRLRQLEEPLVDEGPAETPPDHELEVRYQGDAIIGPVNRLTIETEHLQKHWDEETPSPDFFMQMLNKHASQSADYGAGHLHALTAAIEDF